MSNKLIPKVKSLSDLRSKAQTDPRYAELMMKAASNLGGSVSTLDAAYRWLQVNAMETDERGVIEEVNFCRDLI